MDIIQAAQEFGSGKGLPPVEKWNPPNCGDIGMAIQRDGVWFYQGSPIGRKKMVRLFSRILRRDEDGIYYMVTPVEKVPVAVADVPFLAIEMEVKGEGKGQNLYFRTNVEDNIKASADNPLRFVIDSKTKEPSPYVLIRGRLEARLVRSVFYHLIECGTHEQLDGKKVFGVWSGGQFFPIDEEE